MDAKSGYAEYKVDTKQYPVICMELLEGGDMFDRIQMRKTVSEQYIARIFRDVVLALDGVHKKGFLHRYPPLHPPPLIPALSCDVTILYA